MVDYGIVSASDDEKFALLNQDTMTRTGNSQLTNFFPVFRLCAKCDYIFRWFFRLIDKTAENIKRFVKGNNSVVPDLGTLMEYFDCWLKVMSKLLVVLIFRS